MRLIEATDGHFAWMLAGTGQHDGLRLPEGGVDRPGVLIYLRHLAGELGRRHGAGSWLVVEADEVAGLCGYKHVPTEAGAVEIGYGIVKVRWRQGLGTAAVAGMLAHAAGDARIRRLTAETAVGNFASQRVLQKNGFQQDGTRMDAEDGPLLGWSCPVR